VDAEGFAGGYVRALMDIDQLMVAIQPDNEGILFGLGKVPV